MRCIGTGAVVVVPLFIPHSAIAWHRFSLTFVPAVACHKRLRSTGLRPLLVLVPVLTIKCWKSVKVNCELWYDRTTETAEGSEGRGKYLEMKLKIGQWNVKLFLFHIFDLLLFETKLKWNLRGQFQREDIRSFSASPTDEYDELAFSTSQNEKGKGSYDVGDRQTESLRL